MESNFEQVLNSLGNIDNKMTEAIRQSLGQFLSKIEGEAKQNCPVDTGQLRESIRTNVKREDEEFIGEVGTNVRHALYVEMGTGPVGARSPKDLPPGVTPTYKSTGWVFPHKDGKYRYTEGSPAKPFLYPAFKENKNDFEKFITRAIKNMKG